jgi:hypothetical protein
LLLDELREPALFGESEEKRAKREMEEQRVSSEKRVTKNCK